MNDALAGIKWICLFLAPLLVLANDDEIGMLKEKNRQAVAVFDKLNAEKYAGRKHIFLKHGLIADAAARYVKFLAETTAVKHDEIVEFFVIAENSGHDYEALSVSFAKPSDIHKALEFIGLPAGEPVNEQKYRFWPKGERVIMTFCRYKPDELRESAVRVEKLVHDRRRGGELPSEGLVFVGSAMIASYKDQSKLEYGADVRDPNSIASDYNEPLTVLDIPFRAPQHSVYEERRVSNSFAFEPFSLLEVTISPEYPREKRRVRNLRLLVKPAHGSPGMRLSELELVLKDEGGSIINNSPAINDVLKAISDIVEKGMDPFVSVDFGSNVTVKAAHEVSMILSAIDTEKGMRIEPPPPGQLYYQAFLPDEGFRDRASRVSQPWELALRRNDGFITGCVTRIEQIWKDDSIRPDLKITEYPISSPADFLDILSKYGPGIPVIIVFADADIATGDLMKYIAPALPKYPTVYVFAEESLSSRKK